MRSVKTPYRFVNGKLVDVYGREMEHDSSVLRTKSGKRKYCGRRTYAVRLKRDGHSD